MTVVEATRAAAGTAVEWVWADTAAAKVAAVAAADRRRTRSDR